MLTDIYRIKTRNSVYEIQVRQTKVVLGTSFHESRCRKEGTLEWMRVACQGIQYLDKLCIGPSFDVPGVVQTSNVVDYTHFVLSTEPKRKAKVLQGSETGIPEFFQGLAEHVKEQVNPHAIMMAETAARDAGCSETCPGKDSPAWHNGSRLCKSGSIASGGTRAHCTCDYCY